MKTNRFDSSISTLVSHLTLEVAVKCVKQVVGHTDAVTCMKAKDFTLISGGHDGAIRFWDIRKMQLLYELPVRQDLI
jgi:WD40 repeat protein